MDQPDGIYLPKGSICKDCIHMMVRIIEPLNLEDYGLDEEDRESIVVQTVCLLADVDLHDHIVKECTKFEFAGGNMLMGTRFL